MAQLLLDSVSKTYRPRGKPGIQAISKSGIVGVIVKL